MLRTEYNGLRVRSDTEIRDIVKRLRADMKALYGERLRGVYLFGSYARGEADAESDVDVLIVLDRIVSLSEEITRAGDLISKLSLDVDISVSPTFVSEKDWALKRSPFLACVRREAIRT